MKPKYHVSQNSMYVEVVRVRYRCADYMKLWIRYYSKGSDRLIAEERNVKVKTDVFKFWEVWKC